LHVVTLASTDLSETDAAEGCFISEPLAWLSKSGVHATVVAAQPTYGRKRPTSGFPLMTRGVRYFSLPSRLWLPISGAFLFARVVGLLTDLHRQQHIDLLHAHGLLVCGHAAMLVSRELAIPYIVSVNGLDDLPAGKPSGWADKWRRRIAVRVCAQSRRVVCGSEHIRELVLERTSGSCRTSVVYPAVDPELFSPAAESSAAITVLSGGNLTATAGHDLLIRATASLPKEFPSISLEIIGDGRERSRLQSLVKEQGLANVVHFPGVQSHTEVATAMRRCTLFVLPSQSEGVECMSLAAMACGRPVIGCRGQGISEVIQHGTNGFLVGLRNEKELTLAMGMLLREQQRRQNLGTAARDSILDRFTVAQQAESLRRIYRESIGRYAG
jgi:teichuronic acid biosynthesis glycosyltransferase TuaC